MGDGDEVIDLSPSFFCASNALGFGASPFPADCSLPALSLPLGCHPFSPSCLSSVWAWGWAYLPCRRAVRLGLSLIVRSSCRSAGCLPAFLVSALSSVCGSLCVSRLVAQCGRRVACPAWLVPVNRRGRRDGVPLLAWMRRTGECVDYVERPFIG